MNNHARLPICISSNNGQIKINIAIIPAELAQAFGAT